MEQGDCHLCFESLGERFETFSCECMAMFHPNCLMLLSSRNGGVCCPYCKCHFKKKPESLTSEIFQFITTQKQPKILPRQIRPIKSKTVKRRKNRPQKLVFLKNPMITEDTPLKRPEDNPEHNEQEQKPEHNEQEHNEQEQKQEQKQEHKKQEHKKQEHKKQERKQEHKQEHTHFRRNKYSTCPGSSCSIQ
jgi:hypothetical protein